MIFLPIALLRLLVARSWADRAVVGAYALGGGFQVWAILTHAQPSAASLGYVHAGWGLVAKLYLLRVGLGSIGGTGLTGALWAHVGLGAAIVASVVILVLLIAGLRGATTTQRMWGAYAVIAGFVLFAYTTHSRYVAISLQPGGDPLLWNSRYSYVPVILLLAALAICADSTLRRAGIQIRCTAVVAAVIAAAVVWASGFDPASPRSTGQSWPSALTAAARTCAPPGGSATVALAPPGWTAHVPCSLLTSLGARR